MGRDGEASKLRRCEAHGLSYDASVDQGCVLCRAPAKVAPARIKGVVAVALVAVALAALAAVVLPRSGFTGGAGIREEGEERDGPRRGTLRVTNEAGRRGAYYLPSGFAQAPRPLLVLFHGSGGDGASIIGHFVDMAEERRVILLAPDSRRSPQGTLTWQVGDSGEITPDFHHTQAAVAEILALPGVRIDPGHVLAVGYSGGGSSAPYVATWDARFTAFAVLHGGVFPGGLGTNRVPGWFSTGDADDVRSPATVRQAAESVGTKAASIQFHTFAGGHELTHAELEALTDWWL